jgi:hypothetical protein
MATPFNGYQAMLEEVRNQLREQFDSVAVAKTTARSMLSAASLILAIIGAFSIGSSPNTWNGGIVAALILFVALIIVVAIALSPVKLKTPVEMTKGNIKLYYKLSGNNLIDTLVDQHLKVMKENEPKVKRKVSLAQLSGVLLGLIVVMLIGQLLFPFLLQTLCA